MAFILSTYQSTFPYLIVASSFHRLINRISITDCGVLIYQGSCFLISNGSRSSIQAEYKSGSSELIRSRVSSQVDGVRITRPFCSSTFRFLVLVFFGFPTRVMLLAFEETFYFIFFMCFYAMLSEINDRNINRVTFVLGRLFFILVDFCGRIQMVAQSGPECKLYMLIHVFD